MLACPGDLEIAGLAVVLAFLAAAGSVLLRGAVSGLERPQR
ncbi:MAG TPA: hypothetical protein VGQ26_06525 [Streptosporangiaceae bacterium]|nr:hypothetical protein [Streptosporangiaceae bacterium]